MTIQTREVVSYKNYVAGWLDTTIRDIVAYIPPNSKSTKYALITSLDSDLQPRALLDTSEAFSSIARQAKPVGDGFIVPTALLRGLEAEWFFGFDEVWFFNHDEVTPKPRGVWVVGPRRIDQEKMDSLGDWMTHNKCSLGLGDGEGLNVITKASGLMRYLMGISHSQPQPQDTVHLPTGK